MGLNRFESRVREASTFVQGKGPLPAPLYKGQEPTGDSGRDLLLEATVLDVLNRATSGEPQAFSGISADGQLPPKE